MVLVSIGAVPPLRHHGLSSAVLPTLLPGRRRGPRCASSVGGSRATTRARLAAMRSPTVWRAPLSTAVRRFRLIREAVTPHPLTRFALGPSLSPLGEGGASTVQFGVVAEDAV